MDSTGQGRKKNIQDRQDGSVAQGIIVNTSDLAGMPGTHVWERKDAHNLSLHHLTNAMATPHNKCFSSFSLSFLRKETYNLELAWWCRTVNIS